MLSSSSRLAEAWASPNLPVKRLEGRLLCLPSIYSTADAERERYSARWVKLDSQWVAR